MAGRPVVNFTICLVADGGSSSNEYAAVASGEASAEWPPGATLEDVQRAMRRAVETAKHQAAARYGNQLLRSQA